MATIDILWVIFINRSCFHKFSPLAFRKNKNCLRWAFLTHMDGYTLELLYIPAGTRTLHSVEQ
jgi:hypothetical protein